MNRGHILIVEDDTEIAAFLARGLATEGFRVDISSTAGEAKARLAVEGYQIVILDRMLPDADGISLCQDIRASDRATMILALTAKDTLAEKIAGLAAGADDYITKPFAFEELLARIAVLLRRAPTIELKAETIDYADLHIDLAQKSAQRGDRHLDLTATEFTLLLFLAERAETVQSRLDILKGVWGYDFDPHTNIVEVYIAYLRKKLEAEGETKMIHNQRGFGYLLTSK